MPEVRSYYRAGSSAHRELAAEHPPHVDVAGVRLKALVVAQDLQLRAQPGVSQLDMAQPD